MTIKIKINKEPEPQAQRDTYEYQKDLMDFLFKRGILPPNEAQSGPRFGTIEATFPAAEDLNSLQALLFQIEKYIVSSNQEDFQARQYDQNIEDNFTDPPDSETTALGEIPPYQDNPEAQQVNSQYTFAGYGYLY